MVVAPGAGARPSTAIRAGQRLARPAATAAVAALADDATLPPRLVLREHRREHVGAAPIERCAGHGAGSSMSPSLAALGAIGERCGARAVEQHLRAPTNIGRNYCDSGRDFDVRGSLELTFDSVEAAGRFLARARPVLTSWLARRRTHAAELHLGATRIVLVGEEDLERARAHLERGVVAGRLAAQRRAGDA